MSEFNNCQQNLLVLAKTQGYLTFDDVLDAASTSMLSLVEIDRLSEDLQSLGVMLYDTKPDQLQTDDDTYSDYSRADYCANHDICSDIFCNCFEKNRLYFF